MNPLLSIIIATKNRVSYCVNAINTILSYNNDFQLIIQDNTDNLDLRDYIKSNISDKRLIYNYTPPPFSSIDNFNAGLELASGEYVCLIGDDDGICSTIFEVVKWAKLNNIDSICPKIFIDYYWPDAIKKGGLGYLTIPIFTSRSWTTIPKDEIQNLLNDGIINYMKFNLPKFYHGVIKRSCFEEIKSKTGFYIGGLSPDIYSAISLANIVKKHVIIDFPITIAGACNLSTTALGFTGGHSGKLKDAPHFRDRGSYIWDDLIPNFYSVQTIWAESAIKAIRENQVQVNLQKLNIAKILAKAVLDTPLHIKFFLTASFTKAPNKNVFILKFLIEIIMLIIFTYYHKLLIKIRNMFSSRAVKQTNVIDIREATIRSNLVLKDFDLIKALADFSN